MVHNEHTHTHIILARPKHRVLKYQHTSPLPAVSTLAVVRMATTMAMMVENRTPAGDALVLHDNKRRGLAVPKGIN